MICFLLFSNKNNPRHANAQFCIVELKHASFIIYMPHTNTNVLQNFVSVLRH